MGRSARLIGGALLVVACGSSNEPGDDATGGASGSGGSSAAAAGRAGGGTAGRAGSAGTAGRAGSTGALGGEGGGEAGGAGDAGSDTAGSGNAGRGGSAQAGSSGSAGEGGSGGEGGENSAGTSGGGVGANGGGGVGANGGGGVGANGGEGGLVLAVDTAAEERPISPLIYGINPGGLGCSDADARFGVCRLGGNAWTAYNWENNASNAGRDGCFQNNAALAASDTPGAAVTATLEEAEGVGAATLLTLPVLDHVAADKLGVTGGSSCGDVRDSGTDYLTTRFKQNRARKGDTLANPPDATDAYVNQDEFVAFVRDGFGGDVLFHVGNEPSLWSESHQAIHPAQPTYAEVIARNVEYATLVRDLWPAARVLGYSGYGWLDFVSLQGAPDAAGNGEFVDYYLAALKSASDSYGSPLIDYLDVHWYPELYAGSDRIIGNGASAEHVALRTQAPRSLFDTSYSEPGWVGNSAGPIALIPRLKAKIAQHFPGTKLAISEWSYGGGTHVSGAIAAADALGIFGREEVGLAAFKSVTDDDPFVRGAFRVFRNYDGQGAAFGDLSVSASSNDAARVSVYASIASDDRSRVVIVAINRSDTALDATLTVAHASPLTAAGVFVLSSAGPEPAPAADLTATAPGQFAYTLPAYSISVVVPRATL